MKVLLIVLSVLIATSAMSQSVLPRIGQTETAVTNAYKTSSAQKMAATPIKGKEPKRVAYKATKYTDVFYIAQGNNKVESQHVIFNDTLTRHNFLLKLAPYEKFSDNGWKMRVNGKDIAAVFMIVRFNGVYKEAVIYRPW